MAAPVTAIVYALPVPVRVARVAAAVSLIDAVIVPVPLFASIRFARATVVVPLDALQLTPVIEPPAIALATAAISAAVPVIDVTRLAFTGTDVFESIVVRSDAATLPAARAIAYELPVPVSVLRVLAAVSLIVAVIVPVPFFRSIALAWSTVNESLGVTVKLAPVRLIVGVDRVAAAITAAISVAVPVRAVMPVALTATVVFASIAVS